MIFADFRARLRVRTKKIGKIGVKYLQNADNNGIIRILNNDCVIESGLAPLSIMLCKGFLYENQDD